MTENAGRTLAGLKKLTDADADAKQRRMYIIGSLLDGGSWNNRSAILAP